MKWPASRKAGLIQCRLAVDKVRSEPAAGQVLEVEIHGLPTVREADLEGAAVGDDLVFDQVDHTKVVRFL